MIDDTEDIIKLMKRSLIHQKIHAKAESIHMNEYGVVELRDKQGMIVALCSKKAAVKMFKEKKEKQ